MKNSEIYLNLPMSCHLICRFMSDHNSAAGLQSSLNVNPTSKNHRYIQNYICACWCFQGRMPASWLHFKFITGKSRKTNLYLAQIFLLFLYIVSKVKSSQVRTILSQLNASWLCLPYDSTNIFTLVVKVCKKEKIWSQMLDAGKNV